MRYTYKVTLTPDVEDGGYTVTSGDLYGLVTEGDDFQEAVGMAADALMTYVANTLADGEAVPPATDYDVPDGSVGVWVSFETDASYVMGPCVPAKEAARMLGVSPGRVSQLISAGLLNYNRKGGHVFVEVASIEARIAQDRKAGRPRHKAVAV